MNSNVDVMKKSFHGEGEHYERWSQYASEIAGAAHCLLQNDPDINRFALLSFKVKDSDTGEGTFYSVIVQKDGETSYSEVFDDLLKENQQLKDEMEHLMRLYDISVRLRDNLVEDCSQLQAINQCLRDKVEALAEKVEESDE